MQSMSEPKWLLLDLALGTALAMTVGAIGILYVQFTFNPTLTTLAMGTLPVGMILLGAKIFVVMKKIA